jgi:hypothetical protein
VEPRECDASEPECEEVCPSSFELMKPTMSRQMIAAGPSTGQFCISLRLNDKRVTATSVSLSIFFSLHPFANIWSAVLKLHAIRFATREKMQCVAIDYANVFQI